MSPRLSVLTFIAISAAVAGCKGENNFIPDDGGVDKIDDLLPDIKVNPERVKFGDVNVLEDGSQSALVTISNVGEGDLEIRDLNFDDPTAPFTYTDLGSVTVPAGSSTDVTVTFAPQTANTWKTDLLIDSNDPDEPVAAVRVVGTGTAPVISVDPTSYDFGEPYIGCTVAQPFIVSNIGTAPLTVDKFSFSTGANTELTFDPNGEASRTVEPGASFEVYIDYRGLDTFADKGYLSVFSNDPLTPETLVTATGIGTPYLDASDAFEQPLKSSSDILFIIDNSGSMSEEQAGLTANFESFVNTLVDSDADYQLAVITTDIADNGVFRGDVITPDNSDPVGEFQSQALAGVMGSGDERGTQTAYLSTQSGGDAEPGKSEFMRDRSLFSIIIVTDENDNSINAPAPYTTEEDYYDYFVNDVKDGDADAFKYHGIMGDLPTPACSTAAMGGEGYDDIIALSGGTQGSVCTTDWGSTISIVATGTVALNNTFELAYQPVPETIEVRIDGVLTTVGWTYNAALQSVDFEEDFVPMGGSTIDIDYQIMPTCEG